MKRFLLLLVVILVVVLGSPPLFGLLAENKIQQQIMALNSGQRSSSYLDIQVDEYDRGWFSSIAKLSLKLNPDYIQTLKLANAGEKNPIGEVDGKTGTESVAPITSARSELALQFLTASLPLKAQIQHGPVSVADGVFLGLYKAVVEIGLDLPQLEAALELANMPYILQAVSSTGFTGAMVYELQIPPGQFDRDGSEMQFSGFVINGMVNPVSGATSFEGSIDHFRLLTDEVEIVFNGLSLDGELVQRGKYIWSGTTRMGMRQISIDAMRSGRQSLMIADGLNLEQKISPSEIDDTLSFNLKYELDNLSFNGESKFSEFQLNTRIDDVYQPAIERYIDIVQSLDPSNAQARFTMLAQMQDVLHPLLAASPVITVDPFRFNTTAGKMEAGLNLLIKGEKLPQIDQFSLFDIAIWSNLFRLELRLDMAEALVQKLTAQVVKDQIRKSLPEDATYSDEQIQGMVEMQAPLLLLTLVQQGFMELGGHGYRSHIQYDEGELRVNGAAIPLGALAKGALRAMSR